MKRGMGSWRQVCFATTDRADLSGDSTAERMRMAATKGCSVHGWPQFGRDETRYHSDDSIDSTVTWQSVGNMTARS
jgi:hypothetical protein